MSKHRVIPEVQQELNRRLLAAQGREVDDLIYTVRQWYQRLRAKETHPWKRCRACGNPINPKLDPAGSALVHPACK